jgi:cytochrome c oxidase cbb3-type subunit 3
MHPMHNHDHPCPSARLALAAFTALALLGCGRPAPPVAGSSAPPSPPGVSYEAHLAAGGIVPPGLTLRNPHAGDAGVAKSGAMLFKAMNCDGCHGGDATGWVGPNLGDARWRYGGADAEVFSSIYYGRPKGMPAFGGALGADGVWTLVTYLRSLPLPPDLPTESWEGQ